MIPRKRPLTRSGKPIKRSNPARKAKNFERAYGGEYADWVRARGCVIAGEGVEHQGKIHAHHTRTGGMSRKADANTLVGLCALHHGRWHTDGKWRAAVQVPLRKLAPLLHDVWQTETASPSVEPTR